MITFLQSAVVTFSSSLTVSVTFRPNTYSEPFPILLFKTRGSPSFDTSTAYSSMFHVINSIRTVMEELFLAPSPAKAREVPKRDPICFNFIII